MMLIIWQWRQMESDDGNVWGRLGRMCQGGSVLACPKLKFRLGSNTEWELRGTVAKRVLPGKCLLKRSFSIFTWIYPTLFNALLFHQWHLTAKKVGKTLQSASVRTQLPLTNKSVSYVTTQLSTFTSLCHFDTISDRQKCQQLPLQYLHSLLCKCTVKIIHPGVRSLFSNIKKKQKSYCVLPSSMCWPTHGQSSWQCAQCPSLKNQVSLWMQCHCKTSWCETSNLT